MTVPGTSLLAQVAAYKIFLIANINIERITFIKNPLGVTA